MRNLSILLLAAALRFERLRPQRLRALLFALLRDPVDRVYSRWVSRRRDGLEDTPVFEELVERELRSPVARDDAHGAYLASGMTSHFLQTYLDRFPRERISIHFYEDFLDAYDPQVRRDQGVYYTPDYIVRYIVAETVGRCIEGKKPADIAEMRFADIACGSGSGPRPYLRCLSAFQSASVAGAATVMRRHESAFSERTVISRRWPSGSMK